MKKLVLILVLIVAMCFGLVKGCKAVLRWNSDINTQSEARDIEELEQFRKDFERVGRGNEVMEAKATEYNMEIVKMKRYYEDRRFESYRQWLEVELIDIAGDGVD